MAARADARMQRAERFGGDVLEDGSGLGLSNRLSALSLVRILSAADEEPAQVVRAAALLARRASPVDSDRGRARALGYLTRKGYTYEVAHEAIRAYERE